MGSGKRSSDRFDNVIAQYETKFILQLKGAAKPPWFPIADGDEGRVFEPWQPPLQGVRRVCPHKLLVGPGLEETVRSVELPPLPELSESEVGPLIAGDWITSVTPLMKDLSSSSATWWDEVLRLSGDLYGRWLNAEPMERLRISATTPQAFKVAPWSRIELTHF